MALPSFSPGESSGIADKLQDIIRHLQGQIGSTEAWSLRSSTGNNFLITLSDTAGDRKFSIRNSDGVEVFAVDSTGATTVPDLSPAILTFPSAAAPFPTAEGRAVWDSDNDVLVVGTGTGSVRIGAVELVASSTVESSMNATSAADLLTLTPIRPIAANESLMIRGNYRKTSGNASEASLGLKLNATTVVEASAATTALARTSATNQAEDGSFEVLICARETNYQSCVMGRYHTKVSASGAAAQAITQGPTGLAALLPTDPITSIAIRAIVGNANVTVSVKNIAVYAFQRTGVV